MKPMKSCFVWARSGLRNTAGVTALTRMPVVASSFPKLLVMAITPAFEAE
jgi:hypothetical protein